MSDWQIGAKIRTLMKIHYYDSGPTTNVNLEIW